ncbi:Light dependent period protein LdpA domain-containing protein [Pseudanabaena sp. Chao 1811]|uniref:Light dependent period protein LdpA domain-containing protein n=1 Tax=Pseudanabaena sp. Chao 1811 TaxID=2963092 RepID=UPI0022F3CF00|nr:LdpA C-terminal domain-containing domain [Pseudanabaena sp. Chao 1811]
MEIEALRSRQWFKLICGASYQHLPAIRHLALIYTLAGADCIDMAPDPATIAAAREGIAAAMDLGATRSPLVMVSFNDGEDPHFRKAVFDPELCPTNCSRPCEKVCPTTAIKFGNDYNGVISDLCYGCGRCLPLCPVQIIQTREQVYVPEDIFDEVLNQKVDAIEIHTQPNRTQEFAAFWQRLSPIIPKLQLMAVSFPDCENLRDYLISLIAGMQPQPRSLIWQTDGRPMSGDIGDGATRAALQLGRKVLDFQLPLGFVQLAGGTNASTVPKLRQADIPVAGVAYGSYARKIVMDFLEDSGVEIPDRLEEKSCLLWQAVAIAKQLVSQIKQN